MWWIFEWPQELSITGQIVTIFTVTNVTKTNPDFEWAWEGELKKIIGQAGDEALLISYREEVIIKNLINESSPAEDLCASSDKHKPKCISQQFHCTIFSAKYCNKYCNYLRNIQSESKSLIMLGKHRDLDLWPVGFFFILEIRSLCFYEI